jgi:hypothetical protein
MKASRPADEDRLPWLEPYREAMKPGKPSPRPGYGKPIAIGVGAALLIGVGAGGYWLGQRGEEPRAPRSSETIALPAPKPQPQSQPVQVAEAPPAEAAPVLQDAAPAPAKVTKPARKKSAVRRKPRPKKIRTAGVEAEKINAIRTAQEVQPPPRPAPPARAWPRMPSPGPAGQVIQLGAFTTPTRANNAYHERIARYKSLARMPRVIVPVVTKPSGRVLYVLRLGTTSRQQSKTICRNLRRSGDHCLVIG